MGKKNVRKRQCRKYIKKMEIQEEKCVEKRNDCRKHTETHIDKTKETDNQMLKIIKKKN